MDFIKNIDCKGKNVKMVMSFIVPLVVFFLLTPGLFFEINSDKNETKNKNENRKISYKVAGTHALIFAVFMFLFSYFYLMSCKQTAVL